MNLNNEEIGELLERMEKDSKAINSGIIEMCWYMRGGITYNELMNMSHNDRLIILDLIKKNMEMTNKTGLPFF